MFNELTDKEYIVEVNRLLKENATKECELEKLLAGHFQKSFSYIKQRYRRLARKTIFATHEEFILEKAKELLTKSFCIEVMIDLGFNNESYFATWFRKHTSLNPSEYKKSIE